MKRGTPEHYKTTRLATLLGCDVAEAMGILEMLCNHFAPRSAPPGNIGRCTNAEIAAGCKTSRDPDTLIEKLVTARWLDESTVHRLVIHDWHDHADEAVRKWLIRNKMKWATVSGWRRVTVRTPSRSRLDGVDPPRAGNGKGKGSVVVLGSEDGSVREGTKGKRPLPEPWVLPDDLRQFAEAGGLNAAVEWQRFKDWARSNGALKADWPATFRNWCRNHDRFAGRRLNG